MHERVDGCIFFFLCFSNGIVFGRCVIPWFYFFNRRVQRQFTTFWRHRCQLQHRGMCSAWRRGVPHDVHQRFLLHVTDLGLAFPPSFASTCLFMTWVGRQVPFWEALITTPLASPTSQKWILGDPFTSMHALSHSLNHAYIAFSHSLINAFKHASVHSCIH